MTSNVTKSGPDLNQVLTSISWADLDLAAPSVAGHRLAIVQPSG